MTVSVELEERIRGVVRLELEEARQVIADIVDEELERLVADVVAARLNGAGAVVEEPEAELDESEPPPALRSGPPSPMPEDVDGKRVCQRCGEPKELDEFPKDAACADGRRRVCKTCRGRSRPAWSSRRRTKSAGASESDRGPDPAPEPDPAPPGAENRGIFAPTLTSWRQRVHQSRQAHVERTFRTASDAYVEAARMLQRERLYVWRTVREAVVAESPATHADDPTAVDEWSHLLGRVVVHSSREALDALDIVRQRMGSLMLAVEAFRMTQEAVERHASLQDELRGLWRDIESAREEAFRAIEAAEEVMRDELAAFPT